MNLCTARLAMAGPIEPLTNSLGGFAMRNRGKNYQWNTGDKKLDEFLTGYCQLNRWQRLLVNTVFVRFELNKFAQRPSWAGAGLVWTTFTHTVLPYLLDFLIPSLLALLAVIAWAAAMTTGHFALWLVMLALAAAAIIKRPQLEVQDF